MDSLEQLLAFYERDQIILVMIPDFFVYRDHMYLFSNSSPII